MARPDTGILAPLRVTIFRRIWVAGLGSNLGLMITGVGAAWAMTQLVSDPQQVALVQTSLMAPFMVLSLVAGAMADMYDRRMVAIAALGLSFVGVTALFAAGALHALSPAVLLTAGFVIGSGQTLYGPAWLASVNEQVDPERLPAAVALNSISYNVARSFGPAVGGAIVAASGAMLAFALSAALYVPILVVLALWRRAREVPRLPPERMTEAITAGIRYVVHSPAIRVVLARVIVTGLGGASVSALLPLVARDTLHGTAGMYGLLLGAFGVGGVGGAFGLGWVRARLSNEMVARVAILAMGIAVGVVAISPYAVLTGFALVVAGACWMVAVTLFNIVIQLSAPRWVAGRALAAYQGSVSGGLALGSWMWGAVAGGIGVRMALLASGAVLVASPLLCLVFRLPNVRPGGNQVAVFVDVPQVALALTGRSGPIVIEIEYRIDPTEARPFYGLMLQLKRSRQRNGAQAWSIARDVLDPWLWVERFHCATWSDYLRHRNRPTEAEHALARAVAAFDSTPDGPRERRLLERPFGSVRWTDAVPDPGTIEIHPSRPI